ncbi:MAG: cupin domain-containing protein [Bacteroidia bacterium]
MIYRKALQLPEQKNKAANIAQKLFIRNNWSNSWKNGIYDFHHYHSTTHECMAICMGSANIILGGPGGKRVKVKQGDVIILPAGVGHRCTSMTDDFLCVGGYPQGKDYDMNTGIADEYSKAISNIKELPVPKHDPVFGNQGFLKAYWK